MPPILVLKILDKIEIVWKYQENCMEYTTCECLSIKMHYLLKARLPVLFGGMRGIFWGEMGKARSDAGVPVRTGGGGL